MKEWSYHPSPALKLGLEENFSVFPRERDISHVIIRFIWNILIRLFLKLYFRLKVTGKENLLKQQHCVIVANHASHLDAVCLMSCLPIKHINQIFSAAAKDYFFSSIFRSFLACVCLNAFPFDREKNKRKSLELCADILNVSEHVLIMFPEGSRSDDGVMKPFKGGIGMLVAGKDCWVIPAYIDGAYKAWPRYLTLPRPKKIRVHLGEAMTFKSYDRNKNNYLKIASEVEKAVNLLNPDQPNEVTNEENKTCVG